jgi:hypothetical protein
MPEQVNQIPGGIFVAARYDAPVTTAPEYFQQPPTVSRVFVFQDGEEVGDGLRTFTAFMSLGSF